MITPHFPPDSSAATHRVRLLAPHLIRYGWEPTIVTVDPRYYEGRLDLRLAQLVPSDIRIVRCRAWSSRWTRWLGVGDLGLRAFQGLRQACTRLLREEMFDVIFITIYPTYTAMLGPLLKRQSGLGFVLDYQDPWVGAWGRSVGGGRNGEPDLKSRVTRMVAGLLEPHVVRGADAITAVSSGTYEQLWTRYPRLRELPCVTISVGGEEADFESLRRDPVANPYFDPNDGQVHFCYVGTLLPLGFGTLRAVFRATALLRERRPALYSRLRLHFFGTSNQASAKGMERVLPVALEAGVGECVTEVAQRIDYMEALTVQTQATVILMMGSSEPHYTASKLYPALLARRPILAVYHEESSVVEILRRIARPPTVRLVSYNGVNHAESKVEAIYSELTALVENPVYKGSVVNTEALKEYSAELLAGKLAAVFEQVRRQV